MRGELSSERELSCVQEAADAINSTREQPPDGWGDESRDRTVEGWSDSGDGQIVPYGHWDAGEDDGWSGTGEGVQPNKDARHATGGPSALTPEEIRADADSIDYAQLPGSSGGIDDSQLGPALEDAWNQSYRAATPGERDVVAFTVGNFTWVYDATVAAGGQTDNRLIGVYGRSDPHGMPRDTGRIAGFPSPQRDHTVRVHRGHAVGHQLGGPDEGWNLFPQAAEINQGARWRALEKYCAEKPGTFMFVHAMYSTDTDVPAVLEYGVEDDNGRLAVQKFDNL